MRALVTGSEGFVGRHLCRRLAKMGWELTTVDPKPPRSNRGWQHWSCGFEYPAEHGLPWERVYDVVVHLGANIMDVDARSKAGVEVFEDIALDLAVCRYVQNWPPTHCFVAMSSCAVDWSDDCYGWIKLTLEQYCRRLKCPTVILRPYSGYGADQAITYPFPAILRRALAFEDPLTVWGGLQVRDWLHIDDLIEGIVWAINHAPRGVPVPLGTGVGTNFLALASLMAEQVGYRPRIEGLQDKAQASPHRVADTSLASAHGWRAKVSLLEGISRSILQLRSL